MIAKCESDLLVKRVSGVGGGATLQLRGVSPQERLDTSAAHWLLHQASSWLAAVAAPHVHSGVAPYASVLWATGTADEPGRRGSPSPVARHCPRLSGRLVAMWRLRYCFLDQ